MDYIKKEELILINNYTKGDFKCSLVNKYLIENKVNYNNTKDIIKLWIFIKKNYVILNKLLNDSYLLNYYSEPICNEYFNILDDYDKIRVYKNNFISKITFKSNSNISEEETIKRFNLINFFNTKYLDNVLTCLPEM